MTSSNLIRWSGLASILFGSFVSASAIIRIGGGSPLSPELSTLAVWLAFAGVTFGLFAVIGLYVPQIQRTGTFGLVAFVVALIGCALSLGQLYGLTFSAPGAGPLGPLFPLGYGPFLFGLILFDLVTIWAGVLPRWAAVLLVLGAVMNIAGIGKDFIFFLIRLTGVLVFGIGAIWLGYSLWAAKDIAMRQLHPKPATM